jgi:hypothetical protein
MFSPLTGVRFSAVRFGKPLLLALALFAGWGCGGGARPASQAPQYLSSAKKAEQQALEAEAAGKTEEALACYKLAMEKIASGLKTATASEREALKQLSTNIEPKIAKLELKKKQDEAAARLSAEEAAKKAEQEKLMGKQENVDEKKKKSEAEAKDKEEAAKKREEKFIALTAAKKAEPKRKDDEGDGDTAAAKTETPEKAAEKKEDAPKVPPNFKDYSKLKEPPKVAVDKVVVKGEYAYAYIQVFNRDQAQNKRIVRPFVTFRDGGNGELMPADGVYVYDLFDFGAKDPLEQPKKGCTLTAESHEVEAANVLRLVAVAHDKARASRVRKAHVQIDFTDNTQVSGSGPEGGGAAADAGIPGL